MMRKWIGIIVLLSFAVILMPMQAHASFIPTPHKVSALTATAPHHEHCLHDADAASAYAKADHCPHKNKCCENTCHCIGTSCSGFVGVFMPFSIDFNPPRLVLPLTNIFTDVTTDDRDNRLKRPPRD